MDNEHVRAKHHNSRQKSMWVDARSLLWAGTKNPVGAATQEGVARPQNWQQTAHAATVLSHGLNMAVTCMAEDVNAVSHALTVTLK